MSMNQDELVRAATEAAWRAHQTQPHPGVKCDGPDQLEPLVRAAVEQVLTRLSEEIPDAQRGLLGPGGWVAEPDDFGTRTIRECGGDRERVLNRVPVRVADAIVQWRNTFHVYLAALAKARDDLLPAIRLVISAHKRVEQLEAEVARLRGGPGDLDLDRAVEAARRAVAEACDVTGDRAGGYERVAVLAALGALRSGPTPGWSPVTAEQREREYTCTHHGCVAQAAYVSTAGGGPGGDRWDGEARCEEHRS